MGCYYQMNGGVWVCGIICQLIPQFTNYLTGRFKLCFGMRPSNLQLSNPATYLLPQGNLAVEAEKEAVERLSPAILNHSYRTFLFALALADIEGITVDVEHLYAASMLHDVGLETPDPNCCFAVSGGRLMYQVAQRSGIHSSVSEILAEAIIHHITPGVGRELGELPLLIQWGSLLDMSGLRLWEIPKDYAESTLIRFPRKNLKNHLLACWKKETTTFSKGRTALVERWSRLSWLVRIAPF
jgi:hypothetical protein